MINYLIENDWKWNECTLPIKRTGKKGKNQGNEEYTFQIISCEETGQSYEDKINILMEKSFPFEEETGFVWHKSWNIPTITFDLSLEELQYLSAEYKDLGCEVMAVYPVKNGNSYYLHEVTLEGTNMKKITEPSVSFKYLKFAQTSFNHNRNRFCLLLWVYAENSFGDKDDIFCFISSPIYVDSRKEARKKVKNGANVNKNLITAHAFFAPIGGKRGSVQNTLDSFLKYYSAQNIRGKIKNPLYISYHFDKIFKIYINTQLNISFQHGLQYFKSGESSPSNSSDNILSNKNLFLMVIFENNEKSRKKILSIIEKWKYLHIQYAYPQDEIASKWQLIPRAQIFTGYTEYYQEEKLKNNDDERQQDEQYVENNANNSLSGVRDRQQKDKLVNNIKNSSKNYQLSTMIVLGKPRKLVKREENESFRQKSDSMIAMGDSAFRENQKQKQKEKYKQREKQRQCENDRKRQQKQRGMMKKNKNLSRSNRNEQEVMLEEFNNNNNSHFYKNNNNNKFFQHNPNNTSNPNKVININHHGTLSEQEYDVYPSHPSHHHHHFHPNHHHITGVKHLTSAVDYNKQKKEDIILPQMPQAMAGFKKFSHPSEYERSSSSLNSSSENQNKSI